MNNQQRRFPVMNEGFFNTPYCEAVCKVQVHQRHCSECHQDSHYSYEYIKVRPCRNCEKIHTFRWCPMNECKQCQEKGHLAMDCPQITTRLRGDFYRPKYNNQEENSIANHNLEENHHYSEENKNQEWTKIEKKKKKKHCSKCNREENTRKEHINYNPIETRIVKERIDGRDYTQTINDLCRRCLEKFVDNYHAQIKVEKGEYAVPCYNCGKKIQDYRMAAPLQVGNDTARHCNFECMYATKLKLYYTEKIKKHDKETVLRLVVKKTISYCTSGKFRAGDYNIQPQDILEKVSDPIIKKRLKEIYSLGKEDLKEINSEEEKEEEKEKETPVRIETQNNIQRNRNYQSDIIDKESRIEIQEEFLTKMQEEIKNLKEQIKQHEESSKQEQKEKEINDNVQETIKNLKEQIQLHKEIQEQQNADLKEARENLQRKEEYYEKKIEILKEEIELLQESNQIKEEKILRLEEESNKPKITLIPECEECKTLRKRKIEIEDSLDQCYRNLKQQKKYTIGQVIKANYFLREYRKMKKQKTEDDNLLNQFLEEMTIDEDTKVLNNTYELSQIYLPQMNN